MSSVLAAPQQVPSRVGYFRVGASPSAKFLYEPLPTTSLAVGTNSVIANDGSTITFSSYSAATTALTDGSAPNPVGATLVAGNFYRDMGKSIHVFVNPTGTASAGYRVATLTKVQRYSGGNIQASEGVGGNATSSSATPAAGNEFNTGYITTWTANPSSIPCDVSRVGY
jgi:hypothetical protein